MNGQGIAQIVVYAVVLTVLGYPLGRLHGQGLHGRAASARLR